MDRDNLKHYNNSTSKRICVWGYWHQRLTDACLILNPAKKNIKNSSETAGPFFFKLKNVVFLNSSSQFKKEKKKKNLERLFSAP